MTTSALQNLLAEALGTTLLLAVVIGSGIMAERLSGGNIAIALLANTLATVGGLYILIEVFGPVSGAHFNPAVSLAMAARGELVWALLAPYVMVQLLGAMLGAWLAHAMFDMTILQFSAKVRSGPGQWIAEAVASFGLLLVILRGPPTSARRTGSRPRPPSPIPLPPLVECSATASRASLRRVRRALWWPNWWGPDWRLAPTGSSLRQLQPTRAKKKACRSLTHKFSVALQGFGPRTCGS